MGSFLSHYYSIILLYHKVERVALLTMADLRDSLPGVTCELASYEAAWRGASGSTAAALGLNFEEEETRQSVSVQVRLY